LNRVEKWLSLWVRGTMRDSSRDYAKKAHTCLCPLWAILTTAVAATSASACGKGTEPVRATHAPPQAECRAPTDPGCASCCEQQWLSAPDGSRSPTCLIRSVESRPAARDNEEGYSSRRFADGICQSSCARCADCTLDEEQVYRHLMASGCDCLAPQPASIDPCFSAGCACMCSSFPSVAACHSVVRD
jgi:hypothetical protein